MVSYKFPLGQYMFYPDTTGSTEKDCLAKEIVIRGLWTGEVTIKINVPDEKRKRDNLIANRGLPVVRTDYSL
jgi:hypothetical protein